MYNVLTDECTEAPYDSSRFQRTKQCFGPGSPFSTYLEPVTWSRTLVTDSWASPDGQYVDVDPTKYVRAGVEVQRVCGRGGGGGCGGGSSRCLRRCVCLCE